MRVEAFIYEFLRCFLASGAAFLVDIGVLWTSKTLLFHAMGHTGILFSTALGFIAGLVSNYFLSLTFVFKQIDEHAKQNKIRSFVLFTIIGIMGLLITELCMHTGITLFGEKWYLSVKVATAGIVFIWNYAMRKMLIFKGARYGQ